MRCLIAQIVQRNFLTGLDCTEAASSIAQAYVTRHWRRMISQWERATVLVVAVTAGLATSALTAHGQTRTNVDSLVNSFLAAGPSSQWRPYELFEGCPNLQPWQEQGIQRLMSENLTTERTNDLARTWSYPLRVCDDRRLEAWYFREQNAAIQRGEWDRMMALRNAIHRADSPRIREYLKRQMLDAALPETIRGNAGSYYFERFEGEELMREFISAFATRQMPAWLGWSQAEIMLRQNPDQLLLEIARIVSTNPDLTDQMAFRHVVESSDRRASVSARRALADTLETVAKRGDARVSDASRTRLLSAARHLRN